MTQIPSAYIGRFAPSPSGPLHFGSLVAALGSFLQARRRGGKWLVRIEDIDPPREVVGASQGILDTLEQHQLYWDESPYYQSQQSALYEDRLAWLKTRDLLFYCHCSRAELAALEPQQLCSCAFAGKPEQGASVRFYNRHCPSAFNDGIQGHILAEQSDMAAQFTVKRKDGYYAYQLAVVADDIAQGITEVVRGADLLHATFYQLALYRAFDVSPPLFAHLPVVNNPNGLKLSKQNHAAALDNQQARQNIADALNFLGLALPRWWSHSPLSVLLEWAIENWQIASVPAKLACNDNRISAL